MTCFTCAHRKQPTTPVPRRPVAHHSAGRARRRGAGPVRPVRDGRPRRARHVRAPPVADAGRAPRHRRRRRARLRRTADRAVPPRGRPHGGRCGHERAPAGRHPVRAGRPAAVPARPAGLGPPRHGIPADGGPRRGRNGGRGDHLRADPGRRAAHARSARADHRVLVRGGARGPGAAAGAHLDQLRRHHARPPRRTARGTRTAARHRGVRGVRPRADRSGEPRPLPREDPARRRRHHPPAAPNSPPRCSPGPRPSSIGWTARRPPR